MELMAERIKEIKESMSNEFPPSYENDCSELRNCYSTALGIYKGYVSRDVYVPGRISEYAQKEEVDIIACPFMDMYDIEQIVKSTISDADVLGRNAVRTEVDAPYTTAEAYKIFICKDIDTGLWHFARESVFESGDIIITHKPGYRAPSGILIREGNHLYCDYGKYIILATLELSKKQ